jgi:signal peptidase I
MKIFRKIGNILVIILLVFIAILALLAVFTKSNMGPLRIHIVDGKSMEPTLNFGDLVIFKTTTPKEVQTGNIILFDRLGGSTVHRITEIKGYCVYTKGDNTDPDPGCAYNITAKYLFRIPFLGYFFLGLKFIGESIITGLKVITGRI